MARHASVQSYETNFAIPSIDAAHLPAASGRRALP